MKPTTAITPNSASLGRKATTLVTAVEPCQQPWPKLYGTDTLPVPPYLSVVFMKAVIDPVKPQSFVDRVCRR